MLEETLAIREADPSTNPETLQHLLYNLARLSWTLGRFDRSESLYRRMMEISPEGSVGRLYALGGLGTLYAEQDRFVEAQEMLENTIALVRSTGSDPRTLGYYLNTLGLVHAGLGDWPEAVRTYTEALELGRRTLGNEHRSTAATLGNLANAYAELGELDRARGLQQEVLEIRRRVAGENSAAVAISLRDLARIEIAAGNANASIPLLERYLRIRIDHLGKEHADTGKAKAELARGLVAAGRLEAARERFREARETLATGLGPESPDYAEASLGLAHLEAVAGNHAAAAELAAEAATISREHVRATAAGLSERQARRYAGTRRAAVDLQLSLLLEGGERHDVVAAWNEVARSRALALDEVTRWRLGLESATDPETRKRFDALARASRSLAALLVRGPDDRTPEEFERTVADARARRERAERDLAKRSRVEERSRHRHAIDIADLMRDAPPRSALVAYARYERARLDGEEGAGESTPAYVAFAFRAGAAEPFAVDLGDAESIDRLVADWRSQVVLPAGADPAAATRRYRSAGEKLRAAIWDPLELDLDHRDLVFVVPDGELHRVSFATLPAGDSSYLIEEGARIHYLSAERDLASAGAERAGGRGLLVVAGPEFEGADGGADPETGLRFAPLPGTVEEAETITRLWKDDAVVLTGAAATEAAFKAEATGKRVVHVATHGFFRVDDRRVGTRGTRGIGGLGRLDARPPTPSSPLPLSGLALAGSKASTPAGKIDDGILTAEEIAALDFAGTEWVVLSACDTGLGEIETGEGVLGLRRAFEVSGVGTLVMSLWDVEDAATRRWMESLYRSRFQAGRSTVAAVADASRTTLEWCRANRNTDHPFYWGAFVAVGNWK
jgi:CHAT domain-containing protein/tetratricopeptide (TPR) repeat protein